jgi:hypothetical protein
MAAAENTGGGRTSDSTNPNPTVHTQRQSGTVNSVSEDSGMLKRDFRECDFRREKSFSSNGDPLYSAQSLNGEMQGVGFERKVAVTNMEDGEAENIFLHKEGTVSGAEEESNGFPFISNGPAGGIPSDSEEKCPGDGPSPRYVGSWDSKTGQTKWQLLGDGLHEVQLDWDPTATSYFPKVISKSSLEVDTCNTRPPHTTLSSSRLFSEKPSKAPRFSGCVSHTYGTARRKAPAWKKRAKKIRVLDSHAEEEAVYGEAPVGKRKLAGGSEGESSKKERKNAVGSNPSRGIPAEVVAQPRQAP